MSIGRLAAALYPNPTRKARMCRISEPHYRIFDLAFFGLWGLRPGGHRSTRNDGPLAQKYPRVPGNAARDTFGIISIKEDLLFLFPKFARMSTHPGKHPLRTVTSL